MPHIEFDGIGQPIPIIALPPFGGDEDIPSTVLIFTDNAEFSVSNYRDLGFTHFEVWCVGAAGGRGGDSSSQILNLIEEVFRPVPQDVWNLRLEQASIDDYDIQNQMYYDVYYNDPNFNNPAGWPPGWVGSYGVMPVGKMLPAVLNQVYPNGVWEPAFSGRPYPRNPLYWRWWDIANEFHLDTSSGGGYQTGIYRSLVYRDLFDQYHPSHMLLFRTYRDAMLYPSNEGMGGGGGGGGMQHRAGTLSDLANVVQIVVGKAGTDAGLGQTIGPGVVEANMSLLLPDPNRFVPGPFRRRQEILNYLTQYTSSFPDPRPSWGNPQNGTGGGASSFAVDFCQASGGKGGGAGRVWDGTKFVRKGDGGDGGIGGRSTAGGGGVGSTVFGVNGADGSWRPETGIGGGGGGGKAAADPPPPPDNRFGGGQLPAPLPTSGGRGSYSFGDTSVFGQRQSRQTFTYMRPVLGERVMASDGFTQMALSPGKIVGYTSITTPDQIVPGGGGGARPLKNLKNGSNAPGYSPDGIVILRLTRIT